MKKRVRRQPERSCIACRESRSKRDLIRVVRTPSGEVALDLTGKLSGRGAYLCKRSSCRDKGLNGAILEHHLHLPKKLSENERQRLLLEVHASTELNEIEEESTKVGA